MSDGGRNDTPSEGGGNDERPVAGSERLRQQLSDGTLQHIFEQQQPASEAEEQPASEADEADVEADAPDAEGDASDAEADASEADVPAPDADADETPTEPDSDASDTPEPDPTEPDTTEPADPDPAVTLRLPHRDRPESPEQILDEDPAAAAAFAASLDTGIPAAERPAHEPVDGVYEWPPVAQTDDPLVWEEVTEPPAESEDDAAELWEATEGAATAAAVEDSWNLIPSDGNRPRTPATPDVENPNDVVEPEPEQEPTVPSDKDPEYPQSDPGEPEPTTGEQLVHDAEIVDDPDPVDPELPELVLASDESSETQLPPDDGPEDRPTETEAAVPATAAVVPVAYPSTPATAHVNHSVLLSRRISASGTPPMRSGSRRRNIIIWSSVAAVVVLGALFLIGFLVAGQSTPVAAPTDSATATATVSATPSAAALPTVGPLPVGTYAWNQLLGGECLQPMTDVWAEEFTVVDCAGEHAAQLVKVGDVAEVPNFPGTDALSAEVNGLCQADGVVDIGAAEVLGDAQVQGTFPATASQWFAGERRYYCFVNRAGGEPLTGSLVPAA